MACTVEEVHIGDIGTAIIIPLLECDVAADDVETASEMKIYLGKPSGAVLEKTAVCQTDCTDGVIQYLTVAGDLDEVGGWTAQAWIKTPVWEGGSAIQEFEVYPNLY